jgi:hypothetical protein
MRIVENFPSIVRAGAGGKGRVAGPVTQGLRTLQPGQTAQFVLGESPFDNVSDFETMAAKVRQAANVKNLGFPVATRVIASEQSVYVRRKLDNEVPDLAVVPAR